MMETGLAKAVAIADPAAQSAEEARLLGPEAKIVGTLEAMLEEEIDGVVIATPSALHAEQAIRALEAGAAVFCQKPLGRTEDEVEAVVDTARRTNLLLSVDFSYRCCEAMRRVRESVRSGALGRIYAADVVFHNASGPDKAWFYDRDLSGGGCVMDLGVHLVDLALWTLDEREATSISSKLLAKGEPLAERPGQVEDYGAALIELASGALLQLACSWRLPAGVEAVIGARFYGTEGGAAFHNVGGSFYDFAAERYRGTARETLAGPPDAWGGRAAADWVRRLAQGATFDREAERFTDVARILDRIYGR
jgi:predicted dehydrogenase